MVRNISHFPDCCSMYNRLLLHYYNFQVSALWSWFIFKVQISDDYRMSIIFYPFCLLRSRKKNIMWYGMRGGKELLHRTYRNLEQKVHLECDGQRIPLPTLQGIVVLNIASYGGGGNFWGTTKEDDVRWCNIYHPWFLVLRCFFYMYIKRDLKKIISSIFFNFFCSQWSSWSLFFSFVLIRDIKSQGVP